MDQLRVKNYELNVAAQLHDIVEDCPEWTFDRVLQVYNEEVALLVVWLTIWDDPSIPKEERIRIYHERFRFAPREFFLIKLADRLHNLITLWACPLEKRIRKVRETRAYYLLWAEEHCILIHELEEAIEEVEAAIEKEKAH